MKTGKQILLEIEQHCNEKVVCSSRLRFHIEQLLQRELDNSEKIIDSLKSIIVSKEHALVIDKRIHTYRKIKK